MKILIMYLTGIGNTIMYLPALRILAQQLPEAAIDVLVRHQASKEILERLDYNRRIYVFNPRQQKTVVQKIRFLRALRQERYDVSITTFPANRAEFNLLSFGIGAKRRIACRYEVGYMETLAFLQTEFVAAEVTRHEIEQNLSLLTPLGVNLLHAERNGGIPLTEPEYDAAARLLRQAGLNPQDRLVGFHPGCNPAQGNFYKRWPAKHFAQLGDQLAETFGAKILIGFGGAEEKPLYAEIAAAMRHPPLILENTAILNTAALMKQCRLFVAGDSGLMHLATMLKVPTVALFGPIDAARCAPLGKADTVIKADLPCAPCNKYPHYQSGGSYIRCLYHGAQKGYCMQSITVESVYQTIVRNYADILTALPTHPHNPK